MFISASSPVAHSKVDDRNNKKKINHGKWNAAVSVVDKAFLLWQRCWMSYAYVAYSRFKWNDQADLVCCALWKNCALLFPCPGRWRVPCMCSLCRFSAVGWWKVGTSPFLSWEDEPTSCAGTNLSIKLVKSKGAAILGYCWKPDEAEFILNSCTRRKVVFFLVLQCSTESFHFI